jgi:hypothetical protein
MFLRMMVLFLAVASMPATAQTTEPAPAPPQVETLEPMTVKRLATIIHAIDPDALIAGNTAQFTINDVPVMVVADPRADRMRAMVPIRAADGLDPSELLRLMQANFDTALDARYAVAQGRLWGVFIHPLSPLQRDQFLSGLAQTVNVALTYGQTYSSGAEVFGGGDSNGIYRKLLEDLQKKGQEL